jgi:predicted phosphodiesterase
MNNEVKDLIKNKYQQIAAGCAEYNMDKLVLKYNQEGPAPFSGVVERKEFIVFVLNSGWYCTHDQQFFHGKLEQAQLQWFEKTVSRYKEDGRIKMILMHHHPFNYAYPIPGVDISTMEEGAELMEIAANNGIDIIIHGHRHHPHVKTIQIGSAVKPITMICAGSLSVNSDYRNKGEIPNTIHFLDIDKNNKYQVIYNYKFTEAAGWEPIEQYCRETPIDHIMKVGKIFSVDDIKTAIEKYINCENQQICWENLDECLQFMTYNELNDKFSEILKSTHEVVGKFPEKVVLLKK